MPAHAHAGRCCGQSWGPVSEAGFVYEGGWGGGAVTKGRFFKRDFPSAKFWVKFFVFGG